MTRRLLAVLLALLVASMPLTFAVELRLTYDANGNLVTGDGKYRVYNSFNQLASVYNGTNTSGTLLETYIYHPTEERILVKKTYAANGTLNQTTYYLTPTFVRVVNNLGGTTTTNMLPQLVANMTFCTDPRTTYNFSLGTGWAWDQAGCGIVYNGTSFQGDLVSGILNLSTICQNGCNITQLVKSANITNFKDYLLTTASSNVNFDMNRERNNDTTQHYKRDGGGFSATQNYPDNQNQTVLTSINLSQNATKSCVVGFGCTNNETAQYTVTSGADYLRWHSGTDDPSTTGTQLEIYQVTVWNTGTASNTTSSTVQDFVYVHHDGQLIAQKNPDGTKYYISDDNKGSTNIVTDGSGSIVEHDTYSPFGELLNASIIKFGYEGKESDTLVGDTDFHARKYNPSWGMFTQPDTGIDDVYAPQTLNRYSFERNNPNKYEDNNGHDPSLIGGVLGFAVAVVGYGYTHIGQGRGSLSNFAKYMAKGIAVGLVGAVVGAASAEVLAGGGRIAAPGLAEYGALGAMNAVGNYEDQRIEGNPIDYSEVLAAAGVGMIPFPGFNKAGTFISPTNSFAPNSLKFMASYLWNAVASGTANAVTSTAIHIIENTVEGKPGTRIGSHGANFDYVSTGGDTYPTNSPTWTPRPAGSPGGKGGGSSFNDGGFGSQP